MTTLLGIATAILTYSLDKKCLEMFPRMTFTIFTALHVMQTRYCDENSVRPSVRLSVCHTRVL